MHPGVACVALVPTPARFPLIFARDPRWLALLDQSLLVLFGGVPWPPHRFLAQVVLRVFVYLLKPCGSMSVDLIVVMVEGALPGFGIRVIDGVCPLPSCKGGIALSLAEVGFTAWCIWRPLVLADVERSDHWSGERSEKPFLLRGLVQASQMPVGR